MKRDFLPRITPDGLPIPIRLAKELMRVSENATRLDALGALPATSGNFSLRQGNRIFVSRSGIHKRNLRPTDFIEVCPVTGLPKLPQNGKPSDETAVHLALYEHIPASCAVLHCHPLEMCLLPDFSQKRGSQEKETETGKGKGGLGGRTYKVKGHELLKALGTQGHTTDLLIPALSNSQNMTHVADFIRENFEAGKWNAFPAEGAGAFILEEHGIYVTGRSAQHSLYVFEALYSLLRQRKFYLS